MCEDNLNSREELLKEIMALGFSVTDISLYLDINPTDSTALGLHSEYSGKLRELSEKYAKLYGPLTLLDENRDRWHWIDEPWPWERRRY